MSSNGAIEPFKWYFPPIFAWDDWMAKNLIVGQVRQLEIFNFREPKLRILHFMCNWVI